jgi:hypothetical protein
MKKLYALCFLTIALVAADILLFRTGVAQAQSGLVVVQKLDMTHQSRDQTNAQGNVVGFYCVGEVGRADCFVATRQ